MLLTLLTTLLIPAWASEYTLLVANFSVRSPRPELVKEHIKASAGNCAVVDWDIEYFGTRSLEVHGLSGSGELEGSELSLKTKNNELSFFISSCGKISGYHSSVKTLADGSRSLEVRCRGNALQGEGSGELKLEIDKQQRLRSLQLIKREGWWENFRKIELSCRFTAADRT